ncbi:FecR family protein [Sphingobacterium yanglingense]|uniref:FecR family protein n=1 Tax=Sphingobacterium yanglingense TaxID=1437280 RepID=A0A4R6WPE8_9SPHI|nr:FecR family protein [Sphingobacterium yanglingense]TDQ78115.1 FecR family protein [Sphingobacterium yanglingense]
MRNEKYIIQDLLEKYTNRQINEDEYRQLLSLIREYESVDDVELFMDKDWKDLEEHPFSVSQSEALYQRIIKDPSYIQQKRGKQIGLWRWAISAAAVIAMVLISTLMYKKEQVKIPLTGKVEQQRLISPGGNKATITLANGEQIVLSENQNGIVIDDEQLTYNDGTVLGVPQGSSATLTQTITTPKGGTYQITLSDGTKVWLNAATSLTYSAHMGTSKKRLVKLDGEAYFEVAKDIKKPFVVESKNQTVEVLGTHFNINSYSEESISRTTLLEGSVKVNNTLLEPNQQVVLHGNKTQILNVDAERMIAWKNGKFIFKSESLESIMLKISRWYDVEVIYKGDFSDKVFTGSISRYDDISEILDKISFTKAAKFKIEGRRIIVMP